MKNITLTKTLVLVLCLAMLLSLCACGTREEDPSTNDSSEAHKQFFAMDTIMTVTAYGKGGDEGIAQVVEEITEMDNTLDPAVRESEVFKINNARGGTTEVSDGILTMLKQAKEIYDDTDGALDLSTYPLSQLWGFIDLDVENHEEGNVPSEEEIQEKLALLGFDSLTIEDHTVSVPSGTEISFGAVAKGYASDTAVETLRSKGIKSAIVSLGGNVQTLGDTKPDGSSWNVAVQDPNDPSGYLGLIQAGETAIITSGSYERYFEKDGIRYHHILDPKTGKPADTGLVSVTIVCNSGLTADALSTAMFVLGPDKATEYWRAHSDEFQMIMVTTDNRVLYTSGLSDKFTMMAENYTASEIS